MPRKERGRSCKSGVSASVDMLAAAEGLSCNSLEDGQAGGVPGATELHHRRQGKGEEKTSK